MIQPSVVRQGPTYSSALMNIRIQRATRAAAGILALALGLAVLLPAPAHAGASIRCGSKLVSEGMLSAELLAICGEPDFRDVWAPPGGTVLGYIAPTEEWTYNLGSSQLLRVLRIRNGRIDRISTEGYGFAPSGRSTCGAGDITVGDSKYRLLERCGEPLTRTADYVLYSEPRHDRRYRSDLRDYGNRGAPVFREEWIYNLGGNRLMRIVRLENGRVTDVETGRRGFDR